jgi:hypothetical protein
MSLRLYEIFRTALLLWANDLLNFFPQTTAIVFHHGTKHVTAYSSLHFTQPQQ